MAQAALRMLLFRYYLLFSFQLICLLPGLYAQEIPRLINFAPKDYAALNQNWNIAQDESGCMFFGNSGGMLSFDGAHWKNHHVPGAGVIRSVSQDAEGRIFVGGYATAGYFDCNDAGGLSYHSLIGSIDDENIRSEEIWHYLQTSHGTYFQSFSTIYRFRDGRVEVIKPPGNVMFIREVNGRVLVPVIKKGLFELSSEGAFTFIPGSELFIDERIAAILPYGDDAYIIGTQSSGLFKYENGKFARWNVPVSQQLSTRQLNKALRLSNGLYVFGTILNGLFITDLNGNVLFQINQENGLLNNTVLALHESGDNNLWVGLDKGIAFIEVNTALSFFLDKLGTIGTVYTAILHDSSLFVGTNQGLFHKPWSSQKAEKFSLIKGTQGQVWNLKVFNGQLLCAHNTGTLLVDHLEATPVYDSTGVYDIIRIPGEEHLLLQSTYTGLGILKLDKQGRWQYAHNIAGVSTAAKELAFDQAGRLWTSHAQKGIYLLEILPPYQQARQLDWKTGPGLPAMDKIKASIRILEGIPFFRTDSVTILIDREAEQLVRATPGDSLQGLSLSENWITASDGSVFIITPQELSFRYKGAWQHVQATLLPGNESIIKLDSLKYFLCTPEGYAILNTQKVESVERLRASAPVISEVSYSTGKIIPYLDCYEQEVFRLAPSEKSILFKFSYPYFAEQTDVQYRLADFESNWSELDKQYIKEYTNLPPGSYEFQVRPAVSGTIASFPFVVEPHWYQTWWAACLLALVLLLFGRMLWRWHDKRLNQQRRQLEVEKARELQQQRIQARNDRLRSEVENKSRKLADSTMNLVRKNEMLIKLKKELQLLKKRKPEENTNSHVNKLLRQIDSHISSEDDWEVFESNFNQLHDQFFRRLKEAYPSLTPGDLRLAAYLKMNLSSKEIAPLLNISLRGVENKRYRLRKKMELDPEINLTEYLMQL
jgi:DNA-binding CsgD family transcriptional regulator